MDLVTPKACKGVSASCINYGLAEAFGLVQDNRIDGFCNVAMPIAHQKLIPQVSLHLETWQRGCFWQYWGSGFPTCEDVAGSLTLPRKFHRLALDPTTPYKA